MDGGRNKTLLLRTLVLGGIAFVLLVLVLLDTPCVIKKLTGLPCPTCGMSRAWLSVFRLDIMAAFQYHPMFWGLPVLGLLYVLEGFPFPGERCTKVLYVLMLLGFAGTYILKLASFLSGRNAV